MAPAQVARRGGRIADIEALRAAAILMVVVWHYQTTNFTSGAWHPIFTSWFNWGVGVDLFFAISGFVIARSLLPKLDAAKSLKAQFKTILSFWVRRVFRLFPSVWFWLLFILVCVLIFQRDSVWGSLETNLWASLSAVLHYANYRFALLFMKEPIGTSFPYWSLSLEEQFYVALPLAVLLLRKKRFLIAALTAIIIVQFVHVRGMVGVMFRCEGLALGVLLAIAHQAGIAQRFEPTLMRHAFVRIPALALLFALIGVLASEATRGALNISLSQSFNYVAIVSILLVYLGSFDRGYIVPPGCFRNLLTWIGARSYAMYLCHIPSLFLAAELVWRLFPDHALSGAEGWTIVILAAGLTALFSHLNFIYLETPLNQYGRRLSRRIAGAREAASSAKLAEELHPRPAGQIEDALSPATSGATGLPPSGA